MKKEIIQIAIGAYTVYSTILLAMSPDRLFTYLMLLNIVGAILIGIAVHKYKRKPKTETKELTDEAKKFIPGGVQHNLAFNYPFPLAVERAEGAYLWDADGNRYIDFLQAGGPTVLGSNYKPVRDKVIELLQSCGPVTGLFHEYELKLAELVNRFMPANEMFRMLGSGTESVMAAIRGARAYTKHRKIIKVGGAYHGWSDQMVYGLHIPGSGRLEAKGIPARVSAHTQEFYPNSIAALKRHLVLNRLAGGTAAVIVEPLGPESGTRPVPFDFNQKLRELCDEFGALLIFDEVVSGFRVGMGGAQGYFGVKPDLTIFGKCITGGYPMAGGVGGRAEVISRFAAGIGGVGERAYIGGTLSANPLSCVAGYHALLEMERTNAPVIAGRAGDRRRAGSPPARAGAPPVAEGDPGPGRRARTPARRPPTPSPAPAARRRRR